MTSDPQKPARRSPRARRKSLYRRRAPRPGSRPGAMIVDAGAPPARIRAITYTADRIEERDVVKIDDLAAPDPARGVTWIDVQGLGDEAVLQRIRAVFEIHPLAIADVVNVPQRPKVEAYGDRILIVTRAASLKEDGALDLEQVSLILGPGWILSFLERPGPVFDSVRERLRAGGGPMRGQGPDYLAYALLDAVLDGYFPVVERLGETLELLEEEVMAEPGPPTIGRIHECRRTLLALHRVLWRQRDALGAMLRDETLPFTQGVRVYLRDAHDHSMQALDFVETYRELAVGLMDIYLSSVSNKMNQVMMALTVMAGIFIPLTFIAGIYGMNFEVMPELKWRWGYAGVWAVMIGVAAALALWFRRLGWLGARRRRP